MERFTVKTSKKCELVDITDKVRSAVTKIGVTEGVAIVYCPHTTAGITINENADPDVVSDINAKLAKVIDPDDPVYRHAEGNSDGHIKSTLTGASENIIIEGGDLVLGTWQGVYFAEFDGPRTRNVFVKILQG